MLKTFLSKTIKFITPKFLKSVLPACKYFRLPRFKFYFGPTCKNKKLVTTQFGTFTDYEQKGLWPFARLDYLKYQKFSINIASRDICWKDKYDSPSFERPPIFCIFFGRDYYTSWQFSIVLKAPEVFVDNDCTRLDHPDNYWESILWYLYYYDKNLLEARKEKNNNTWSTIEYTDIEDFKVIDSKVEKLFDTKYWVYTIESDELYFNLEYEYPYFNSNNIISVNHNLVSYVNIINSEDGRVQLWMPDEIEEIKTIRIGKHIYLGSTFKDEFLNRNGRKLVKKTSNKCDSI